MVSDPHDPVPLSFPLTVTELSPHVPVIDVAESRQTPRPSRRRADARDVRERWLIAMAALVDPAAAAVDALAVRQALRALADATVRARAADLECFAAFCRRHGTPGLPASPATVVAYLDALAARGQKATSLARKLSSLGVAHQLLGLDNPCRTLAVHHALRAIRKECGVTRRQALAVRLGDANDAVSPVLTLRALVDACGDDPRELRDAALLSMAYDGGLRASEVIAACVEDIAGEPDGSGVLHLRRSKTDQVGEGAYVYLSAETMMKLGRWLEISTITSGTVFRAVYRRVETVQRGRAARLDAKAVGGGKFIVFERAAEPTLRRVVHAVPREDSPGAARLSLHGLAKIYRAAARRAADRGYVGLMGRELDAAIAAFSTHGFRVGLTQDLFAEQFDVGQIQLAMRWKSASTALGYARKLNAGSNAAAQFLRVRRAKRS